MRTAIKKIKVVVLFWPEQRGVDTRQVSTLLVTIGIMVKSCRMTRPGPRVYRLTFPGQEKGGSVKEKQMNQQGRLSETTDGN